MTESVTIFFFANSNHLSNVKTLQSIYKQDYENINLLICNDCTYGFENERLLNNFEAGKPENIRFIHYHENPRPIGEYASQVQFWNRIDSEYIVTIHAGEYFTEPSVLRNCINNLKIDKSLDAVVTASELWSDDFKKRLVVNAALDNADMHLEVSGEDMAEFCIENIRDCMVIYRMKVLRDIQLQVDRQCTQTSQCILAQLLQDGKHISVLPVKLCKYSESSIQDREVAIPSQFGNVTLKNIEKMLRNAEPKQEAKENMLFRSSVSDVKPKQGRNIHLILYKLSTLSRIGSAAILALLFFIAAGLFMHLETAYAFTLGSIFMICAIASIAVTIGMLGCNLYYKRNPQRLVNNNESK